MKKISTILLAAAAFAGAMAAQAQQIVIAPATGSTQGAPLFTLGEPLGGLMGETSGHHLTVGHAQGQSLLYSDDTAVSDVSLAEGDYRLAVAEGRTLTVARPADDHDATLRIYSLQGAEILVRPLDEAESRIDLSALQSGVYAVIILSDGQVRKSAKFILK